MLSRNVGKKLPLFAASLPSKAQFSATSWLKSEVTHNTRPALQSIGLCLDIVTCDIHKVNASAQSDYWDNQLQEEESLLGSYSILWLPFFVMETKFKCVLYFDVCMTMYH